MPRCVGKLNSARCACSASPLQSCSGDTFQFQSMNVPPSAAAAALRLYSVTTLAKRSPRYARLLFLPDGGEQRSNSAQSRSYGTGSEVQKQNKAPCSFSK